MKKFGNKGFTLIELLAVVGIMTIFTGFAILNINKQSEQLSLAELDNVARSVYLSSQSELLSAKNMGTLSKVNEKAVDAIQETAQGKTKPNQVQAITKADAIELGIITDSLIDSVTGGGDFIIEYHPVSGSVYGVFFAHDALEYDENQDAFTKRDKNSRKNHAPMVGYYGSGLIVEGSGTVGTLDKPQIEIVNEEKLSVQFTTNQTAEFSGAYIEFIATVVGENGGRVKVAEGVQPPHVSTTVRLDSLDPLEKQFKTIVGDTIHPGENIVLEVEASYTVGGKTYTSKETSKEFNSLFADKSGDMVDIACGRHLQNLDTLTSGNTENKTKNVNQIQDIDFGEGSPWNEAYLDQTFTSIENSMMRSYQGNDKNISDIKIIEDSSRGMFTRLDDVTIEQLNIIDPTLKSESSASVGILAGEATGAIVDNVRIYAKSADTAKAIEFTATARNGSVGGFIGQVTSSLITNSSLSLGEMNANGKKVGTFVGAISGGTTVENCYSAVDDLTTTSAGGFFVASGTKADQIKNCYTVGNLIHGNPTKGFTGFVKSAGVGSAPKVTNSYTAVTYEGTDENKIDAFVDAAGVKTAGDTNAYLDMEQGTPQGDQVAKLSYKQLVQWEKLSGIKVGSSTQSTAYGPVNPSAYPFDVHPMFTGASVPNHHYGSWPEQTNPTDNDFEIIVDNGEELTFDIVIPNDILVPNPDDETMSTS